MDKTFFNEWEPLEVGNTVGARGIFRRSAVGKWARNVLWSNPFYPLSAALMLFGIAILAEHAAVTQSDVQELFLNVTTLQGYLLLLGMTAIFLSRLRNWYDSTLLVWLTCLMLFTPMIFLNQAVFMDPDVVYMGVHPVIVIMTSSIVLSVTLLVAIRQYYPQLNLPWVFMAIGCVLLLFNLIMPIWFHMQEDVLLGFDQSGAVLNVWLYAFPMAVALTNLLPRPFFRFERACEKAWLPISCLTVFLGVTGFHLYWISFVYDVPFRGLLLLPLVWVLAWTAYNRVTDFTPVPWPPMRRLFLVVPAVVPFFFSGDDGVLVWLLPVLNVLLYAHVGFGTHALRHIARQLALFSAAVILVNYVGDTFRVIPGVSTPSTVPGAVPTAEGIVMNIFLILSLYLAVLAVLRPRPVLVGAASVLLFFGMFTWLRQGAEPYPLAACINYPLQASILFVLINSLRWDKDRYPEGVIWRFVFCIAWVAHSGIWIGSAAGWTPYISHAAGAVTLLCMCVAIWSARRWTSTAVVMSAATVLLMKPVYSVVLTLVDAGLGISSVIASLLLFGAGTILALMRKAEAEEKGRETPPLLPPSSGGYIVPGQVPV